LLLQFLDQEAGVSAVIIMHISLNHKPFANAIPDLYRIFELPISAELD
jgi:hypothetical protein